MKERKPHERYAKGKFLGWYILWDRKQTWLGRDRSEAMQNWDRLRAGLRVIREGRFASASPHYEPTVRETTDAFLAYVANHREKSESTHRWY